MNVVIFDQLLYFNNQNNFQNFFKFDIIVILFMLRRVTYVFVVQVR